ncbi:hypothetical protein LWE61_12550 [Sphingobium sufflavum]|uniref:hypothetical protein n=1 Tax=Sphingobium sufflavum TaxID=1129547 RepID=UPI001F477774|nr:hypothetical protein [Sphingobium sufflavum]MCE7797384.1 hypothetical protein [Sphingobium sufflavum]
MRPLSHTHLAHARLLLTAASLAAMLAAAPAQAQRRTEINPYLGIDQTAVADLGGGDRDTLTYTSVIVGVDASIQNRSTEVRANLAYQHQFTWSDNEPNSSVISGVVSARTNLIGRALQLEGGVLATRVRTDGFTGANGNLASAGSKSQIYSAYVGPTFTSKIGDLDVNAAYRLGYNRLEDGLDSGLSGGLSGGGVPLDSFSESWTHVATASVGMQPGVILPVGWAVGVGYNREDASQLSQRYEDKWGKLDLTLPVTGDLAVIGGVGYQAIEISNKDALRDGNGAPVRDRDGRFVTDANSPRLLSYDNSELIWDVGILWRPSRRTSLSLTVGHRYGSESVRGSLSWQPDERSSLTVSLYDSVDSFGRALSGNLANLPDDFIVTRNPFSGDINGCAFGQGGDACFSDTLSGIRTANYRNRGVSASYAHTAGPWRYGIGVGYSQRKFLGNDPVFARVNGLSDENYFAAAALGYALDDQSGIDVNVYANQFKSGISGVADVFNAGAYLSYHRRITRRLNGHASVGVDHVKAQGVDSVLTGLAQIGLRYSF